MRAVLLQCSAVGLAGFLGALLRVGIVAALARFDLRFPLAILLINVSGSFLLGGFATYAAGRPLSDTAKLAIGAGFVGAFTTFSTLMLDTTRLAEDGYRWTAAVNLVGSVGLGLIAVRLGMMVAGRL